MLSRFFKKCPKPEMTDFSIYSCCYTVDYKIYNERQRTVVAPYVQLMQSMFPANFVIKYGATNTYINLYINNTKDK